MNNYSYTGNLKINTLVDSHCHLNLLNLDAYNGDLGALIEAAKQVGVEHILCVGIDLKSAAEVIQVAERFTNVSASVGLHPSENVDIEPTAQDFIEFASHPKVIAIGETGLDYHYEHNTRECQQQRFRLQIQIAKQLNKPLIIHTRAAQEDTINIMRTEHAEQVRGVMHCFTEEWAMAEQALALNFYISFSGIVTFKNATIVADVAKKTPLDRVLIETDAPYLTPVPHRGKKPNEPQYVRFVAEKIAELKGITVSEVAQQTTQNFYQLFKK